MSRQSVIAGLLLLTACADEEPTAEQKVQSPKIEAIQKLIKRECECRMAGFEPTYLQEQIETLTDGLIGEGYGTSSDPITYSSVCYPELGERACANIDANMIGSPELFVCTSEQGLEVESAYFEAEDNPHGSTAKPDAAAKLKIEELRQSLRETLAPESCK